MADNFVRLGLALTVIMLISCCLYSFGGRQASAVEPPFSGMNYQR
jgi:hypothetical protein